MWRRELMTSAVMCGSKVQELRWGAPRWPEWWHRRCQHCCMAHRDSHSGTRSSALWSWQCRYGRRSVRHARRSRTTWRRGNLLQLKRRKTLDYFKSDDINIASSRMSRRFISPLTNWHSWIKPRLTVQHSLNTLKINVQVGKYVPVPALQIVR